MIEGSGSKHWCALCRVIINVRRVSSGALVAFLLLNSHPPHLYGIVIDAGSVHTAIYSYRFSAHCHLFLQVSVHTAIYSYRVQCTPPSILTGSVHTAIYSYSSHLTLRRFCYDKARELKFGELAVHVYKKTRHLFLQVQFTPPSILTGSSFQLNTHCIFFNYRELKIILLKFLASLEKFTFCLC